MQTVSYYLKNVKGQNSKSFNTFKEALDFKNKLMSNQNCENVSILKGGFDETDSNPKNVASWVIEKGLKESIKEHASELGLELKNIFIDIESREISVKTEKFEIELKNKDLVLRTTWSNQEVNQEFLSELGNMKSIKDKFENIILSSL